MNAQVAFVCALSCLSCCSSQELGCVLGHVFQTSPISDSGKNESVVATSTGMTADCCSAAQKSFQSKGKEPWPKKCYEMEYRVEYHYEGGECTGAVCELPFPVLPTTQYYGLGESCCAALQKTREPSPQCQNVTTFCLSYSLKQPNSIAMSFKLAEADKAKTDITVV